MKSNIPVRKHDCLRIDSKTRRRGFTLAELLVVIGVIALLAALLLPALNNARHSALRAACLSSLQQLAFGMDMYVGENIGVLPGMASRSGFNAADWIYWRTNSAYPQFEKSPLLTALSGQQKPSLRCPLDISDTDRIAQADPVNGPYLFSYAFTGYGVDSYPGLPLGVNLGMSSVFTSDHSYFFKLSDVHNPAAKLMLVEEASSTSESAGHSSVINDGRWMPKLEPLTNRHRGWADVTFADDHAESVRPEYGNDLNHSQPGL